MDPLSALSIATGIITFVDFGAKLVSRFAEIKHSDKDRPDVLSTLEAESKDLSGHATHARNKIASLRARYPRQSESLARLDAECVRAEKDLQKLADSLTVKSTAGGHHGVRAWGALAMVTIRGVLKQGDIDGLEARLRSIREQMMMSVIMCILDDALESHAKLKNVDNSVGEVLDVLRPLKRAIDNLQPEFRTVSGGRPLATDDERERVANGLWASIAIANIDPDLDQAHPQPSPAPAEKAPENDSHVHSRILNSLAFEDMTSRESHIKDPFPETFKWLVDSNARGEVSTSPAPPTPFREWLESQTNETPFWITGNPASGKSTLMKFIVTNPVVQSLLRTWSGEFPLLTTSVYFWNPGSSGQKSQAGLLSTILYQLLSQRRDLYRHVAPRRYWYFRLAGADAPEPPGWTLDELRDSVTRFVSLVQGTSRLAVFVDGLDEYEGNLETLVSFLKQLHHDYGVKLCVSSRPWNTFRDAFHTYPSLRMELLTKPDISKYVYTRIGDSLAFKELRKLDSASVEKLESQIIDKADGVFLWVVLVVEQLVATARENNDLREIWEDFESMPPGLAELYGSMRRRLDPAQRAGASRMYQLLFQWNDALDRPFDALAFWMAVSCHDPTKEQPCPQADFAGVIQPALERRLAGATGGILQIRAHPDDRKKEDFNSGVRVVFLHRTVFDWLREIKSSIVDDGPADYDPGLVLTSVLVSRLNFAFQATDFAYPWHALEIGQIFAVARSCKPLPETRSKMRRIVERVRLEKLSDEGKLRVTGLDPREIAVLSSYSDSSVCAYLAAVYHCAPYLQAKLESSEPPTTGLEPPRGLHRLPTAFWNKSQKQFASHLLYHVLFPHGDLRPEPLPCVNRRLRTLETLLQAPKPFISHRTLRAAVKQRLEHGVPPKEFWGSLQDGLDGKGFVELTSIEAPEEEEVIQSILRSMTGHRGRTAKRGFREYMHDQKHKVKEFAKQKD